MNRFRLITTRKCRVLTLMGWGLLSMLIGAILFFLVLFAYPFLAPTQPVDGEILIVEGWLPVYALEKVKNRFQDGKYKLLITTGGNFTVGHPLSQYYKSWANIAAATLNVQGVPLEKIMLAPTTISLRKNRTYQTALAVKKRLNEKGLDPTSIDVASLGAHSRRTWLMFKKAFPLADVGVVTLEPKDYDVTRWWISSAGVRDVISEALAYFYARLIFSPSI